MTAPDTQIITPASPPSGSPRNNQPHGRQPKHIALGLGILTVAVCTIWLASRVHGNAIGATREGNGSLPAVAVEQVGREDLVQTLSTTAEFHPYEQVALHAKVAGYLQAIWVDVGDHVREGQALAQLDVPEMHEELRKATAALGASEHEVARAEANYTEAHFAFQRFRDVAKEHPKLVAQQELDSATARDATAASAVEAAKQKAEADRAEISKLKAMIGYTTIISPFDGVITRRLADPGALIQAGTAANTQPLVEIAQDKKLRLVFPVPESSVPLVKVGATVRITVGALGESFEAIVSRYSGKIDRATRTMSTEVDVENSDGRFKPGMIAVAELVTRETKDAVAVPVQAISVGETPTVFVVGQGETVEQRSVKLGLETPAKAEVLEGLQPGDRVLVGSRNGIQPGQKVSARLITTSAS